MKPILLLPLIILTVSCTQPSKHTAPDINDADIAQLTEWISAIGSDALAGRSPMTEYEDKTLDYLTGEMEKLGLKPAFDGSWLQEVDMITTVLRLKEDKVSIKGSKGENELTFPDDLIIWTARADDRIELKDCDFVFAGFGIDAPEYGWDDLAGMDVRGKIVVAMVNDPGYYDPNLFNGKNMTYYGRFTYKFEQAEKLGAAGCLVVHNTAAASYGWDVLVGGHMNNNYALYDKQTRNEGCMALKGWIHEDGCRKLLSAAGLDFDAITEAAKKPGFKAIDLNVTGDIDLTIKHSTDVTHNIAGVIAGTDLKDEALVFSAHWDHLGIGKPDEKQDSIYNGASDNGSGIAAILLIAKKFQEMPLKPRRSLVFLCPTLEESGLYGSQFYCEHPVFPMEKTAACINFDCIAPAELTEDISFLGGGKSELDYYVMASAAAQGRYAFFDDDNSDGWFFRSDHYNFVKKGVPALVMENGSHPVDPSRPNIYPQKDWYHKPCDEYREDWDMSGTIANINVMLGAGAAIANADTRPRLLN